MNNQEFITALSVCFEAYGKKLSPAVGKFWLSALNHGGISLDQAATALSNHALNPDTGQFLPKIADIVKHCSGTTEDKAEVAWGRLQHIIRTKSPYNPIVIDDKRLMNAIELSGGFVKLCTTPVENEAADRAAFRKAYTAAGGDTCRKFLPGLHDDGELQMIGDIEICKRILETGTDKTTVHELSSKSLQQLTA